MARLDAAVAATEEGSEVSEGTGLLEAGIGAGEHFDRLRQQGLAVSSSGYEPGGPQRHSQGAWGSEAAGQLELFATEASRRVEFTKGQSGQGGLGAPREVARAQGQAVGGDLTGRPKVGQSLTEAMLSEPKAAPGVTQYHRGLRRAGEVDGQGLESPLGLVEVAPLNQHVHEYGRRTVAQKWRGWRGPGGEQGPRIRLCRGGIGAAERGART